MADAASGLDAWVVDAADASVDALDAAPDPHVACGYETRGSPSYSHSQNNKPDGALPQCRDDLASARVATASDLRVTVTTTTPTIRSESAQRLEITITNVSTNPIRILRAEELLVTVIDATGNVVIPPPGKPVIIGPSHCGEHYGFGPNHLTLAPAGHAETALWWEVQRMRFQRLEGCDYEPPWPMEATGPLPPGHYRLRVSIPLEKGSSLPGEVQIDVTKPMQYIE